MLTSWYSRRIIVATTDKDKEAVTYVQRVLGGRETGEMDDQTKSRIRGMQILFNLPPTGIIDDATAEQVERIWPYGA